MSPSPVELFLTFVRAELALVVANHDADSLLSARMLKHELDTALTKAQNAYTLHLNEQFRKSLRLDPQP